MPPAMRARITVIPKDEVGRFFVEQYYKTMSGHPEKLYLFYDTLAMHLRKFDKPNAVEACE